MNAPDVPATGIAFVGCGYVADFYRMLLPNHADKLRLVGVFDIASHRTAAFARTWGDRPYPDMDTLLGDPAVSIVVNLTPPNAHAGVTRAAIAAGKHVYSEKPLAMTAADAGALQAQARAAGVRLAAAPCNLLGEQAQTLWRAVRSGRAGRLMLAYAELDDGMIHRTAYRDWRSRSGAPWPANNEFEVGCTFEHAGYVLTLLAAMFGPVRRVTAFSTLAAPDKQTDEPLPHLAPDVSVGCLEFDDGFVARVTNSVVAPYDHRLRLFGDRGTLLIDECWDFGAPVRFRPQTSGRLARWAERELGWLAGKRLPLLRNPPKSRGRGWPKMDFVRGIRELADAIRDKRRCRLDEDFAVHVTEVTEMLQHPDRFARPAVVTSTFAPIEPMEWAQ